MSDTVVDWEKDLERWLVPFLGRLQNVAQRRWMPLYVQGLLGPGERKSVEAMAERVAPGKARQLQNFLSAPPWSSAPLEELLVEQANRLVGGPNAVLVIDDTAFPKKGTPSVGVASQYAGVLGKTANCQVLVSLTLADREVPVPLTLRLFLPEMWTQDPERCRRAGIPSERVTARTKPEMALDEVDRLRGLCGRYGEVVAPLSRLRRSRCRGKGCRLWPECRLPPGTERPGLVLGRRHSLYPDRLYDQRRSHLADSQDRPSASPWGGKRGTDCRGGNADSGALAARDLEDRNQGSAHCRVRGPAGPGRGWPAAARRHRLAG